MGRGLPDAPVTQRTNLYCTPTTSSIVLQSLPLCSRPSADQFTSWSSILASRASIGQWENDKLTKVCSGRASVVQRRVQMGGRHATISPLLGRGRHCLLGRVYTRCPPHIVSTFGPTFLSVLSMTLFCSAALPRLCSLGLADGNPVLAQLRSKD